MTSSLLGRMGCAFLLLSPYSQTVFGFTQTLQQGEQSSAEPREAREVIELFVETHCLACHDSLGNEAELAIDELLAVDISENPAAWERVVRKLNTRQMPPGEMPRPTEAEYKAVLASLTGTLDRAALHHPHPGRTDSLRRLNRTEYQNAIRDLLALEVDVSRWLPKDESSHGFDNITVTGLSPSLLNRYVSAAQEIARLAVGGVGQVPGGETFRVRPDITQDHNRVPGMPLGTRGGMLIPYHFPQDGEYQIQVWLMRDRNDEIEGLRGKHELEVLVDREKRASFTIQRPPRGQSDRLVDANLSSRVQVTAGKHDVAVTFVKQPFSLLESERQPLNVHYNFYRHPRLGPAVYQVSITGPFDAQGPGDTPSRRRIFVCRPSAENRAPAEQERCATRILTNLLRRAYRRPVEDADLAVPLKFFREGSAGQGFEAGIERALAAILVNPQFLFRIERQPSEATAGQPYRISDLELASRLSFFIWSSIPDDELLAVATRGELQQPDELERQVERMLADPRADSLVTNFADQWLYLRNLDSVIPDARRFPDFDHNLRQAFREETERLFRDVLREDKSVLALIDSDYTYLNERLAEHYGIPHVQGSRFRKVSLAPASRRGGILRHGSILSVTSYATRTSPVLRGTWILENIIGSPPPPPPPNIPALDDNNVSAELPVRERLAVHRANQACAVCHDLIDPVGFGLENFDAVGRWRELEMGQPVDATGGLPGVGSFVGVDGLEQALLKRSDLFAQTLAEKLMTFALGRGIEPFDAPAIRRIVNNAEQEDYRLSALILGITQSPPFQMRMAE